MLIMSVLCYERCGAMCLIVNVKEQRMTNTKREQRLTLKNRQNAGILAEGFLEAFNWDQTPQGAGYWSEVWRNLMLIANGGNSNA